MSGDDVRDVLRDEIKFLEALRKTAEGYKPATTLGGEIVAGWIGTFKALAKENGSFVPLGDDELRKGLDSERTQLKALAKAVIPGHPDEESWKAFFDEDIRFADKLKKLLDSGGKTY